jgi:hypothetical protein
MFSASMTERDRSFQGFFFDDFVLGFVLTAQYSCASLIIFASSAKQDGFIK